MADIKDTIKPDGELEVDLKYGSMNRNSTAWHPDTGEAVRNNVARITENKIPVFNFKPELFYTFTEPTIFMDYEQGHPKNTSKWMVGPSGRMEEFEAAYSQFEKLILGQSHEGRDIIAYRLGANGASGVAASGTKHCLITSAVHGNEVSGEDGLFKAMEILAENPRFQNFREEWTLVFVPACNPDGYYHYTRNLLEQGPDGKYINLNRNWDWFWSEFTASSSESKGASPISTKEAKALDIYRQQIESAGGQLGACCDFHATSGQPCRYMSRDRQYNHITDTVNGTFGIPSGRLTIPIEWYVRGAYQAIDTLRAHEASGKDVFLRYYRSAQKPHMHPYWSSKGAFAIAVEDAKTDVTKADYETIASACNHRLDFCLAFCASITRDNWEFKDAVLVEKGTTNILRNANWADWQDKSRLSYDPDAEERPSYFTRSRMITNRITAQSGIKHFKDNGEAVKITCDIDISLQDASEFNAITYDGADSAAIVCSSGSVYSLPSVRQNSKTIIPNLHYHTSPVGAAACSTVPVFSGSVSAIDILGGGTGRFVGATSIITRVDTDTSSDATAREYRLEDAAGGSGTGFTARAFGGYADNYLDSPTDANKRCWTIGGMNESGTYLDEIGMWSQNAKTFAVQSAVLPSGMIGCAATYDTTTNNIYIFGGQTTGGLSNQIYQYDTGSDNLTNTGVQLPSGTAFAAAAYLPNQKKIYIYGGKRKDGLMSEDIFSFDPIFNTITQIYPSFENLSEYEDNETNDSFTWNTKYGNWTAVAMITDAQDDQVLLAGGRSITSSSNAVTDVIYKHNIISDTLSTLEKYSFGYYRYSTLVSSGYAPDYTTDSENFCLSVYAKSTPDNVGGYYRTALHTNDTNGPSPTAGQRYIRNFYTIPPKTFYKWYHVRCDLNEGSEEDWEDGVRAFSRIYNDGYSCIIDGMHLQAGSMLASSYQPFDEPRQDEIFTLQNVVNPNSCKISFYWMATTSFVDLDSDLELMRIEQDSSNYLRIVALAGSRYQRNYRTYDVHGPHNPQFRLEKYVDGTMESSASIVCYWNYDLRGGSVEPQEEVLKFTIEHLADEYMTFRINKYGFEGRKTAKASSNNFSGTTAQIKYNGHGWYSAPIIYDTAELSNGRAVPARRGGLLSRLHQPDRECIMTGEWDPNNGDQINDTAYTKTEHFDYPDDDRLTSNWRAGSNPYYSVGGGWYIQSSGAVCAGSGFNRYDLYPQHGDLIIKAKVKTTAVGDRVAVCGRWQDNLRNMSNASLLPASGATCYAAELRQSGANAGLVRIMKWYHGYDTQLAAAGLSSYTPGEQVELILAMSGVNLTATVTGRGTCSATDSQIKKPRRTGIYGIADGSHVYMNEYLIRPNFPSGVSASRSL